MIAAVRTYLDRTTGAGRHAPRTAARRHHPAGKRLERTVPATAAAEVTA